MKPLAFAAVADAVGARQFGRAIAASIVALTCATYSITAELQLAATARGDAAAERQGEAQTVADLRAARDRARTELDSIAPARPIAELQPQIDAILVDRRLDGCESNWLATSALRAACIKVAELKAEAARADRRQKASEALQEAEKRLAATHGTERAADPLAGSLVAYASALGLRIDPSSVTPWLSLLPVVFLETVTALGVLVTRRRVDEPNVAGATVQTVQASTRTVADVQASTLPMGNLSPAGHLATATDRVDSPAPKERQRVVPPARNIVSAMAAALAGEAPIVGTRSAVADAVIDHLRRHGGRWRGSQRGIAFAVGATKSTLNNALSELVAAGRVRREAGTLVLA